MNYRTMLLASAAVLFTASANAADFTSPFALPSKGHVISETKIETTRTKYEKTGVYKGIDKGDYAREYLKIGVADNLAVTAHIGNTFMYGNDELNNDHNFDYALGLKYNINSDRVVTQLTAAYRTYDPRSWYGKHNVDNNRWVKILAGEVKVGYLFDCGLTPYTSLGMEGAIDEADRDINYSWFVGAHKLVNKWALDGGIRYNFSTDTGNDRHQDWFAEAKVDYYVKDNVTVGGYADYYLGGKGHHYVDYGYTAGLALKVLF